MILDKVGAEEQEVLGTQDLRDLAEEAAPASGREVPERATEEHDKAWADGWRDLLKVALEIADHAMDGEAGILVDQCGRAVAHHRLGHVDRHVSRERAGLVQGIEQHPRLRGCAGPEFDQLGGAGGLGDVGREPLEDSALGARGVVLRQFADTVKQLRAAVVVEVFRREFFERPRQPVENVVGERALRGSVEVALDHALRERLC